MELTVQIKYRPDTGGAKAVAEPVKERTNNGLFAIWADKAIIMSRKC